MPHHCHLPGCTVPTPRMHLFCRTHWFQVPKYLRDEVWAAYYEAGGTDGPIAEITDRYLAAVKAAEEAVLGRNT